MFIKKLVAIILFSINMIPRTETTLKNRFANIRITSFSETMRIHTVRYTFVSSVKCSVELKVLIIKSDGKTTTLSTTVKTIEGSYAGSFRLRSSAIENNDTLLLTAQSDTYYCVREFVIYVASSAYKTVNTSTTYTRNDAVQVCQSDGYQKRYKESIKVSLDNQLIRQLPYITTTNLKINYQCDYSVKSELEGKEIFLIIDDKDNNFPLLQDSNKMVKISYNLTETSIDNYQMQLNEKLYYNPTTLILSRVPKDGFIPTKTIYVPKNCKTEELTTIYQIKSLGYQSLNLNIESTNTFKKFVGSCSSSKYCVRVNESNNYLDNNEIEVKLK